jgi:hypothetical protein
VESKIVADRNYVLSRGVRPSQVIRVFGGTAIRAVDRWFSAEGVDELVDVVAPYHYDAAQDVSRIVDANAGPNLL